MGRRPSCSALQEGALPAEAVERAVRLLGSAKAGGSRSCSEFCKTPDGSVRAARAQNGQGIGQAAQQTAGAVSSAHCQPRPPRRNSDERDGVLQRPPDPRRPAARTGIAGRHRRGHGYNVLFQGIADAVLVRDDGPRRTRNTDRKPRARLGSGECQKLPTQTWRPAGGVHGVLDGGVLDGGVDGWHPGLAGEHLSHGQKIFEMCELRSARGCGMESACRHFHSKKKIKPTNNCAFGILGQWAAYRNSHSFHTYSTMCEACVLGRAGDLTDKPEPVEAVPCQTWRGGDLLDRLSRESVETGQKALEPGTVQDIRKHGATGHGCGGEPGWASAALGPSLEKPGELRLLISGAGANLALRKDSRRSALR